MAFFVNILGSLVLAGIIILGAIYLYFRVKLGKFSFINHDQDLSPLFIHLNEDVFPEWLEQTEAIVVENELIDLGFTAGKAYVIPEMEGMKLKAFFQVPYITVLYTHPMAGIWVDIGADVEDGYEYTVSNAPMGEEMKTQPQAIKYFMKDVAPARLFERLRDIIGDKPCVEVNPEDFRTHFENVYKREMKWKNKQGGISLEEFVKVSGNMKAKFTDQQLQDGFREYKRKELHKWHDGALEEYTSQKNPAKDFAEVPLYDLFIVPLKAHPLSFLDYLNDVGFIEDENVTKFEKAYGMNDDIPLLFKRINSTFSDELQATKQGEVEYPIAIDIYSLAGIAGR